MKKFILLAVVAVMAVFACQKQEVVNPEATVSIETIQLRSFEGEQQALIKEISESENYYNFVKGKSEIAARAYNSDLSSEDLNLISRISVKQPKDLSENEFSELMRIFNFDDEVIFESTISDLLESQELLLNEFPTLRNMTPQEFGGLIGESFDQCQKCVQDIFGVDAKTNSLLDDDQFVFSLDWSCSSEDSYYHYPPTEPGVNLRYCCSNYVSSGLDDSFLECATNALNSASGSMVLCGAAGLTATSISTIELAGAGSAAGPVGFIVGGGAGLFIGLSSYIICLQGVQADFNTACAACNNQVAEMCIYVRC